MWPTLEYRHALDICVSRATRQAGPLLLAAPTAPALLELVQRLRGYEFQIAGTTASSTVQSIVAVQPTCAAELAALCKRLTTSGTLYVVCSGALLRRPLDTTRPALHLGQVVALLKRAGLSINVIYGLHSPTSLLLGRLAWLLERGGRSDLADRCTAALRASYVVQGAAAWLAPVALVEGYRAHTKPRQDWHTARAGGLRNASQRLQPAVEAVDNTPPVAPLVLALDAWLDTMRGPMGYGGPVAHWWFNTLLYTGAGIDWRYEGIIIGYLNLYHQTSAHHWLSKARRAADDVVRAQQRDGRFAYSTFELNPATGGTPHEAACALALLHLAAVLQQHGDSQARYYQDIATRNLYLQAIARYWDDQTRSFRDAPGVPSFVPNKAATLAEALLLLARLTSDEWLALTYALPTLDAILALQVRGGPAMVR
ncbi:MAG: hypothetical protein HC914_02390 [Chloroflexaceae bacterium]|nr:hypothetical protein [Chloroflexaceae bacterium]